MARQTLTILSLLVVFLSCQNHPNSLSPGAPPTPASAGQPANPPQTATRIPRNEDIDSVHAYNSLFLDTAELDAFIANQHLNDTLATELHNFYNFRNFQFAWFDQDGLSEQALAFSSLYQYSSDSATGRKWLDQELDILQTPDSGETFNAVDPILQRTEMLMTWRFMNFLNDRYPDEKQRLAAYLQLIPIEKRVPLQLANTLVKQADNLPASRWYKALVSRLKQYLECQEKGGWGRLPQTHRSYRPGDKADFLAAVRKRLQFTRDLPGDDTSQLFDKTLEEAVKSFQTSHGLKPDGHIGPDVIRELNKPVEARIAQIVVNLERMRWLPIDSDGETPSSRPQSSSRPQPSSRPVILINIPDFRLQVLQVDGPVLTMNVVVGKEGHSTVLFSGKLNEIIFNPYWNIPSSIVQKELLPEMDRNPFYLAAHDMEAIGVDGGVPVIRQLPGDRNELGRIKFLFPNSFNIYLHDSPHKELFSRTRRAFSHGCIRVADAPGLAAWLLRDMPEWSKGKIHQVIASGDETPVDLTNPVTVLIVYYTAWVDENDKLQFREDIYSHDSAVATHLFTSSH